jgi:translation initiation factor IF-1
MLLYFIPFVSIAQEKQIKGVVVRALPSGNYRVKLLNDSLVLGYLQGQVKRAFIRFYKGDTVIIAINPEKGRGEIIYRRYSDDDAH